MLRQPTGGPANTTARNEMSSEEISKIPTSGPSHASEMTPLPVDYEVRHTDVICARGKDALNHPGNKRFRALVDSRLDEYSNATSKLKKSTIVTEIINAVRRANPYPGGFLRKKDGRWYDVGDHIAREKTGQSFRDILHFKYRSSTKAKRSRKSVSQKRAVRSDEGTSLSPRNLDSRETTVNSALVTRSFSAGASVRNDVDVFMSAFQSIDRSASPYGARPMREVYDEFQREGQRRQSGFRHSASMPIQDTTTNSSSSRWGNQMPQPQSDRQELPVLTRRHSLDFDPPLLQQYHSSFSQSQETVQPPPDHWPARESYYPQPAQQDLLGHQRSMDTTSNEEGSPEDVIGPVSRDIFARQWNGEVWEYGPDQSSGILVPDRGSAAWRRDNDRRTDDRGNAHSKHYEV